MRRPTAWGSVLLGIVAALVFATPAAAAGTGYFVTIAARTCPDFTDISANKARNNIQESLRDLGPDTLYKTGELVNPTQEQQMQPNCTPLTGFRFTFGTGISSHRVVGPWGSLSVDSGPFDTDITTLDAVPDRNGDGTIKKDGSTIEGAVTIELTESEKSTALAKTLVLQGGTPTDPVLYQEFPNKFAFGALRCSDDNLNGDNVEYARFSQGLKHIYCFAYYVVPPPKAGTIVITKHVSDPSNATQTFTFQGNISYTSDQTFPLTVKNGADASMTFYRAATDPGDPSTVWTAGEQVPPNWQLRAIDCTAPGGSVVTRVPPTAPSVAISLKAGDTVHCTFTDALKPPPGQLTITKVTDGGVDTFPFTVTDSDGKVVLSTQATTTDPGTPAKAANTPVKLDPGTYRVAETLPSVAGGRWVQTSIGCNAERRKIHQRIRRVRRHGRVRRLREVYVDVKISSSQGQVCQFGNRFIPSGRITILKTTLGGVGTTGFTVTPLDDPSIQKVKSATTTEQGRATLARGDSTRHLPLGRYLVQEHATQSDAGDDWELVSATCDGRLRAFEQGQVIVELTADNPRQVCRFVNALSATPIPPIPPTPPSPTPVPPGPPPTPAPQPNLVLTKRALKSSVRVGRTVGFLIQVRNTGAAAATNVVVADAPGRHAQLVSARPSQGTCDERTPVLACRLGTIGPGKRATIRVRVRATGTPRMINVAVVGSGTPDSLLSNNTAFARVRVRKPRGPVACPAADRIAHAAC
jgi:uncharacterized repeat protein (TIGR01451 family)